MLRALSFCSSDIFLSPFPGGLQVARCYIIRFLAKCQHMLTLTGRTPGACGECGNSRKGI
jgi:hypothetical protein